jgi:hypothetical protein
MKLMDKLYRSYAVRRWLDYIKETDYKERQRVIAQCLDDDATYQWVQREIMREGIVIYPSLVDLYKIKDLTRFMVYLPLVPEGMSKWILEPPANRAFE